MIVPEPAAHFGEEGYTRGLFYGHLITVYLHMFLLLGLDADDTQVNIFMGVLLVSLVLMVFWMIYDWTKRNP